MLKIKWFIVYKIFVRICTHQYTTKEVLYVDNNHCHFIFYYNNIWEQVKYAQRYFCTKKGLTCTKGHFCTKKLLHKNKKNKNKR